jgi:uncharacterized protein (DUF1697 family)
MPEPSPTTWVALLRGINLGRAKRIAMADLRSLLGELGFDAVRTHLQSGNAVFASAAGDPGELEDVIAAAVATRFGFDVKVLVRTAPQLAAVVDGNPFAAEGADPKQLHVAFLSAEPPAGAVAELDHGAYAPDEFRFGDRAIYLRLANGVMGSRLPDWERTLGVDATMRNWNTVTRLRDLAAS